MVISIIRVGHTFRTKGRRVQALLETDLKIHDREFVTIVGPSGCGKSTLMNIIVGLFRPRAERCSIAASVMSGSTARSVTSRKLTISIPGARSAKMSSFRLSCVTFGRGERRERAERLIRRVGLARLRGSYPHELSGGMRQRANIIRTLVYEPEVILMDEPFGPLDAQTRLLLQNQLLELWHEERKTIVFITHDLGEAVALADRVVVMSARPGRIKTIAPVPIPRPRNLFEIHSDERFRETYRTMWASLEEEVKKGAALMASTDLTRRLRCRLAPPMSRTTIEAWQAEERRGK